MDSLALCLCLGSLEFGVCFLLDSVGTFARGDGSVRGRLFRLLLRQRRGRFRRTRLGWFWCADKLSRFHRTRFGWLGRLIDRLRRFYRTRLGWLGRLIDRLRRFYRTRLGWLGRLIDRLRWFYRTRFDQFWRPRPPLRGHPARPDRLCVCRLLRATTTAQWEGNGQDNYCNDNAHNRPQSPARKGYAVSLTTIHCDLIEEENDQAQTLGEAASLPMGTS